MKLWSLNKYWMSYGMLMFALNVTGLLVGSMIISMFALGIFSFGCLLALASLYKIVDAKVSPKPKQITMEKSDGKLIDVVYLREKDVLKMQVSPDAPFSWFLQKIRADRGGE